MLNIKISSVWRISNFDSLSRILANSEYVVNISWETSQDVLLEGFGLGVVFFWGGGGDVGVEWVAKYMETVSNIWPLDNLLLVEIPLPLYINLYQIKANILKASDFYQYDIRKYFLVCLYSVWSFMCLKENLLLSSMPLTDTYLHSDLNCTH